MSKYSWAYKFWNSRASNIFSLGYCLIIRMFLSWVAWNQKILKFAQQQNGNWKIISESEIRAIIPTVLRNVTQNFLWRFTLCVKNNIHFLQKVLKSKEIKVICVLSRVYFLITWNFNFYVFIYKCSYFLFSNI